MTIGDDLQVLLGLVPVRDRAGIQRGTMATEAARAADGNTEGQALTRQGFDFARATPPSVQVPPGMGEPDAANMPIAGGAPAQFVIPGSTGGTSAAPTPAPRERVVAASPAAAPSPEVTRNSDIMLAALKQQQQQAKMQQLFSSIGLIANGLFNRDPSSANATRQSLAGGLGGGGGTDLGTLKALLEMRGKEDEVLATAAAKRNAVDVAQRMFGLSKEDAEARWDTGELKKLLDPENIAKREIDKRAGVTREELMTPAVVAEIAKRTGMPEAVVRADIRSGKIDQKTLVDIAKDQAATAKTKQETADTGAEIMSYEEAKNNRAKFMERYDLSPSGADRALANRPAFNQFTKDRSGATTAGMQGFEYDRARAREQGPEALRSFDAKYPDLPTYERSKMPSVIEEPGAKLGAKADEGFEKDYRENLYPKANEARQAIEGRGTIIADLFRNNIKSGGKLSQLSLDVRKTIATALKMPLKEEDINTEVFFSAVKQNILARESQMKGTLSEGDMRFLAAMNGSMEQNPETLRRLQHIEEKLHRADIDFYRERFERDQANPNIPAHTKEVAKRYAPIEQPRPTKITEDIVKQKDPKTGLSGLDEIRLAKENGLANDPDVQRIFNQKYGRGMFKHYLGASP